MKRNTRKKKQEKVGALSCGNLATLNYIAQNSFSFVSVMFYHRLHPYRIWRAEMKRQPL